MKKWIHRIFLISIGIMIICMSINIWAQLRLNRQLQIQKELLQKDVDGHQAKLDEFRRTHK